MTLIHPHSHHTTIACVRPQSKHTLSSVTNSVAATLQRTQRLSSSPRNITFGHYCYHGLQGRSCRQDAATAMAEERLEWTDICNTGLSVLWRQMESKLPVWESLPLWLLWPRLSRGCGPGAGPQIPLYLI